MLLPVVTLLPLSCFWFDYYLCFQSVLLGDQLGKLSVGEGTSLADQVALTIGL